MLSTWGLLAVEAAPDLAEAAQREIEKAQREWTITIVVSVAVLLSMIAFSYLTRAGIIARAATKEAIRQPLFFLLFAVAVFLLILNTYVPFFTLGEDVKMLKDCGLMTLLICGLLLAIWTASNSIAAEVEGKTAMTLLSKPINRRQFILGKYFGILNAVQILLIPLMMLFVVLIYYKYGYDAKESSKEVVGMERWSSVLQILPGFALTFLEIAVMTAVSIALSTRVPMIVNMVTCLAFFVVGHLTPAIVKQSTQLGVLEPVEFAARLVATILPSLDSFNMQAAVATGSYVPPVYLGYSALYCFAYSTAAILLAFILFEDRDLA